MKLYRVPTLINGGYHWFGTQAEAKTGARQIGSTFDQEEVPTDKSGLLNWLNNHTIIDGFPIDSGPVDELHLAEQRAIAAARPRSDIVDQPSAGACSTCGRDYGYDHYESAMSARTSLAQIDAGMIARAIGQFHGSELSKVVGAAIERMRELALQVGGDVQEGV